MPFDPLAEEQEKLRAFAAGAHPVWLAEQISEVLIGYAVMFERARRAADHYFDMTFVQRATFGGEDDPDWLDGLAREIGLYVLAGESVEAARLRLREVPAAVTLPQVLQAVESFLERFGQENVVAIEQLPRDAAFATEEPAVTADAAGYAFAFEPAADAWGARAAETRPFAYVVVVPSSVPDPVVESLRVLLDEVGPGGYSALVERSG